MESKLKDLMKHIEAKEEEIRVIAKKEHDKKVEAYHLKLEAMVDYEKALGAKDHVGMKKTEEMCWKAKQLKMEAKKMCEQKMQHELEKKKLKNITWKLKD